MGWKIDDDAAWIAQGGDSYRHYTGVQLLRKGTEWIATAANGTKHPARRSASSALKFECGFSVIFDWGRKYGTVRHPSEITHDGVLFAFVSPDGSPFTSFVVSSLKRRFHGYAECIKCKKPMSEFLTAHINQFDGSVGKNRTYLVCECGFPVWHMETNVYYAAEQSLNECAKTWQRQQDMKAAGGRHTREEIDAILQLQKGRCIYCNVLFTADIRPTRDHLVPLSYKGTAWPLNIVLACRSCNSRRGEIPFRTFCRLLSPRQNERILQHLFRRIRAIDFNNPGSGYEDFEIALRMHVPNDGRYRMILDTKARYRENARRNKLLPRGTIGILNEITRRQRVQLRLLRQEHLKLQLC